jgi:hypothetical protein
MGKSWTESHPRMRWIQKILGDERQRGSEKKRKKRNEEGDGIRGLNEGPEGKKEEKNIGMQKFKESTDRRKMQRCGWRKKEESGNWRKKDREGELEEEG